jgi:hypothetical protein
MKSKELRFCSMRSTYTNVNDSFEKCIEKNQCFDDEPCPLQHEFCSKEATNSNPVPATKELNGLYD